MAGMPPEAIMRAVDGARLPADGRRPVPHGDEELGRHVGRASAGEGERGAGEGVARRHVGEAEDVVKVPRDGVAVHVPGKALRATDHVGREKRADRRVGGVAGERPGAMSTTTSRSTSAASAG